MIDVLNHVEENLIDILNIKAPEFKTMYIDYHKPFVSRIWFQYEEYRVFLHKIEPCNESKEALYHPHKWESAMRILRGEYEMGVGHSETNEIPKTDCKLFLRAGSSYEMTEKDGWHYVCPKQDVYTLMVTGKLNDRKMPVEPSKKFRKLTVEETLDILYTLRESNFKQYSKLDVSKLVQLINF